MLQKCEKQEKEIKCLRQQLSQSQSEATQKKGNGDLATVSHKLGVVERERDYFRDKNTNLQKELRDASKKRADSVKKSDERKKSKERKQAGILIQENSPDRGLVNL